MHEPDLKSLCELEKRSRRNSLLSFDTPKLSKTASSWIATTRQEMQTTMRKLRGNTTGRSTNASSSNKKKKELPGERELELLIENGEYEVLQDPYRGLFSLCDSSVVGGASITTPWHACQWGTLSVSKKERLTKQDLKESPGVMTRHVGHCACPSLQRWTAELSNKNKTSSRKSGKKRSRSEASANSTACTTPPVLFQLGTRPQNEEAEDLQYRCVCDYNPLCLASMGGVFNDIIKERCQEMQEYHYQKQQHLNTCQ